MSDVCSRRCIAACPPFSRARRTPGLSALPAAASARPLTTAPTLVLTLHDAITDSRIVLDRRSPPRGIEARFVIENKGAKAHNLTLGQSKATADVQKGFSPTLEPNQQKVVRLFLDFRSTLRYLDALPADRGASAMRGTFTIT